MDQDDTTEFAIGELAERAGVTPRTIRFYVTEGLLPPPGGAGQHRVYTWEHELRLQLIKRLKEQYLPLGEIRARLAGLSVAELEALLRRTPEPPSQPSGALDYIASVLGRSRPGGAPSGSGTRTGEREHPVPATAPALAQSPPAPAAPPISPALRPGPATPLAATGPEAAAPAQHRPPADPSQPQAPPPGPTVAMPHARLADPAEPTSPAPETAPAAAPAAAMPTPGPRPPAAGALWRRVLLGPGIELHYQPTGDTAREARIARLIRESARLLNE